VSERILARHFHAADGAEAWRVLPEGAYAFFRSGSFAASARFVEAMSLLVREGDEPHVDIRPDGVTVLLRSFKDAGYGLMQEDLDSARAIARTARDLGLTADPAAIQSLLVIPGATERSTIMPFWRAVLAYAPRPDSPDEDLVDPHERSAPFWFEEMDELRPDGKGSVHLVVWLPWDQAEARVAAGIADPAGNEVDIATSSAPDPVS
jgi:4a-hydroxytetrahydrobiopterin dehydratase